MLNELWEKVKGIGGKVKAWVRLLRADGGESEARVPIWSVHPKVQGWYYWAFTAQTLWITVPEFLESVWGPIWHRAGWAVVLTGYKGAWDAISNQLLSAAITSLIVTEIGGTPIMLVSRLYENLQKVRNERREEGRKEGRKEERVKFEAERASLAAASTKWLKRRDEAQQKGEPFDEEPPWNDNGASES